MEGEPWAAVGGGAAAEEPQLPLPAPQPGGLLDKLISNVQAQRARQLRRMQQLTARAAEAQRAEAALEEKRRREEAREEERKRQQQQLIAETQRRAELAEVGRVGQGGRHTLPTSLQCILAEAFPARMHCRRCRRPCCVFSH